jgi:hypothetical protein
MIGGVSVGVGVKVAVETAVSVAVGVNTGVSVAVGVPVDVAFGGGVIVVVAPGVGVSVGVPVRVGVGVAVPVAVPVGLTVGVVVRVGVHVGGLVGVTNWSGVARRVAVAGPGVKVANELVGTAVNSSGWILGTAVFVGVGEMTTGSVGGIASTPPSGACLNARMPKQ